MKIDTVSKIHRKLNRYTLQTIGYDLFAFSRVHNNYSAIKIGTEYGGWVIPENYLNNKSICYCVGCGEDISFDLGIIEKYNCHVFAYDPTPRSIEYVKNAAIGNKKYHFHEVGLWSINTKLKFYEPGNKEFVSHSVLNLQKTDKYFEAEVKNLRTIMEENKHGLIDYLKIDIEGAEYEVIKNIIDDKVNVKMLSVEFDECFNPLNIGYIFRVKKTINLLLKNNYRIIFSEGNGNFTFLRN